jgi:hypothetical protein
MSIPQQGSPRQRWGQATTDQSRSDCLTGARGRGLGVGEQLVKVAAQNPHAAADAQRRQRPWSIQVADRLLIELQDRGDLSDGQELVVGIGRAALRLMLSA